MLLRPRQRVFVERSLRALDEHQETLGVAPTGAGKTLVAEYAIDQATKAGRKVIYTSPIKALSNQKFRDFKNDGMHVGLMTGDLSLEPLSRSCIERWRLRSRGRSRAARAHAEHDGVYARPRA